MGFIGIAIILFIILAILGLFITMIVCFIASIALRKKKRILSHVLMTVSIVIFLVFTVSIKFIISPKPKKIETPNGTEKVMSDVVRHYREAVDEADLELVDSLLTEYPALLYQLDYDWIDALQYYTNTNNVEGVELLLSHGAYYDNGITLRKVFTEYSFISYFYYSETHPDMEFTSETRRDIIRYMLDNGAKVNYIGDENTSGDKYYLSEYSSPLLSAVSWAADDGVIDEYEYDSIEMIVNAGADLNKKNRDGQTALDIFELHCSGDGENIEKCRKILIEKHN